MTAIMPTLGSAALFAAVITYGISWFNYRGIGPKSPDTVLLKARRGMNLAAVSLLVSSVALMWLLMAHYYRVEYVYSHVSSDLPFLYVVSAFWAGQEGSFLLWAFLVAVIGLALTKFGGEWEAPVMRYYLPSAAALVVVTIVSGPFKLIPQIPTEGAGLNPLLRDPWMAIHPPVTFMGYSALSIPFAFALAAMDRKRTDEWVRQALPWTLFGWLTLGTGIIMGGYWAYKVLGWGGWWGWDPVENASLLPWLMATALFHGMLLQRARAKFVRMNVLLTVLTFGLVIYSTYLTRSGALEGASVHTFGASNVGIWLAFWLVAVVTFGVYRLTGMQKKIAGEKLEEPFLSREMQLVIGALVLIASVAVVGLGTSAPIISRLSGGSGAAVDISFYGRTTLPLGILLALGIGLSVMLRWKGGIAVRRNALIAAVAAAIAAVVVAYLLGVQGALYLLFAGSSVFGLVANLVLFERALSQGGIRTAGGHLSHVGAALMLIAVIGATTGKKEKKDLIFQEPTQVLDYELTFTGWSPESGGKQSAMVSLARPGGTTPTVLKPKLYEQYGSGRMMVRAEPHIERGFGGDLYLAPAQYLPPEQAMEGLGETFTLAKGESYGTGGVTFTFGDYDMGSHNTQGMTGGTIGATVTVEWEGGSTVLIPRMAFGQHPGVPAEMPGDVGGELRLQSINADMGQVTLLHSGGEFVPDGRVLGGILTVELSEKPLMGVLWMGVILVLLGGGIAIWRRMVVRGQSED